MSPAKKPRFYVVWKGRQPGVFNNWNDCAYSVNGFPGAKYKSFATHQEAVAAFNDFPDRYLAKPQTNLDLKPLSDSDRSDAEPKHSNGQKRSSIGKTASTTPSTAAPLLNSIAVDAACSGNPGVMEYQGVETATGEKLFHKGPFENGTNNVGEFLALVHALAYLKQNNDDRMVYSDSRIAIGWVKKKSCRTTLKPGPGTSRLFELIRRAESWLKSNQYTTEIRKWDTANWGEIPADFGRK